MSVAFALLVVGTARPVAASEERCVVTYTAPPECPGVDALEQEVGPHFHVVRGAAQCDECVAHIEISAPTADGEYVLQTGDEPTRSKQCGELVKVAGFTVRSSHVHHQRPPQPPLVKLGAHAGQVFADVPQWILGGELGLRLGQSWFVRSHVSWTPRHPVASALSPSEASTTLQYEGYQAGLDGCRSLWPWADLCLVGMLQWFKVSPNPEWTAPTAAQVMVGLAPTLHTALVSGLELQFQPAVVFAPRPAIVRESDWSATLYERPRLQVQIRAGFAWGFGGSTATQDSGSNFAENAPPYVTQ